MSRRTRILLLLLILVIGVGWWLARRGPDVADGSVLVLELSGEYVDAPVSPLLGRLLGTPERSLLALLSQLSKAERDERLHAVVLHVRDLELGWGKAEEIRQAVGRLREAGRPTVAFLEVEGFGNAEYYVASAAERVVMAPAARNPMLGLAGEYLFLGGLWDKLGVELEYERVGRYKSAVETFAEEKMSDDNRAMMASILDSIDAHFVNGIAEGRGLEPDTVRGAIDEGVTRPERLREIGLVDEVAYLDEVLEGQGDRPRVKGEVYAAVDPASVGFEPRATFALVYAVGPVVVGEGDRGQGGRRVIASERVAKAIEDAAGSGSFQAILLRVDSPGGSPLASDRIWHAVRTARAKGVPVVASYSDVAASGGYYLSAGADRIVSHPSTLTGSIGVFVIRPNLSGLLDKLAIGVETMTRGDRADLLLSSQPLSPGAREVLRRDVRSVYRQFLERVAEGRAMSREEVDAVGGGRVWTGSQAHERGLVDGLGGLREAAREAKQLVDLDPDADVGLQVYPPPKPLAQQLAEALGGAAVRAVPSLPLPEPLAEAVEMLRTLPAGAPLLIPPGLVVVR
ncbi:MAG: signal peptide peptidase SppA [Myxococcota bacterium]|nr:signal peptide peptidase SppA [Myxococcota bacterium]